MSLSDTIIAQATPPGTSALGILRISGPHTKFVAIEILGSVPIPRFATYSSFLGIDKKILDKGVSLWFPAPFSFTGEDILELQVHGNPVIIDLLIKRILLIKNIRMAKPGEFSERAFLNGKIDLIQAESIDDLIHAETESAVYSSLNSLQGVFSSYIQKLIEILIQFRVNIESSLDFSEEEIFTDSNDTIILKLQKLRNQFIKINYLATQGNILKEGKSIVITGPPNAGKSTLFNALSNSNRAIVTKYPGTTRDLIHNDININGFLIKIVDTAGLRDSIDEVESIGIQRAWEMIKTADHILFVIDQTLGKEKVLNIYNHFISLLSNNNIPITIILNKKDLFQLNNDHFLDMNNIFCISLSAHTGEGIDILRNYLIKNNTDKYQEGIFIARRRHLHQLELAYSELLKAEKEWIKFGNLEFLADSLRLMNQFLGEITGKFTSNDLLDHIFSNFCIGK